jgi:membrane associated rhomboid family serine protease
MIDDRDYMRQPEYHPAGRFFSMTVLLIVANLMVFVLLEISNAYTKDLSKNIFYYCALSNEGLSHGFVWQYLTFQFLHVGPWHFIFNMLALFIFGRPVEERIGGRRLLLVYLACGVVGGVFQTLLGVIFPDTYGVQVAGASAGVFGLLAVLAALEPDGEILIFFFLPSKMKYLAWSAALVATFYVIVPAQQGIAHAAHLGGMAMGVFYVQQVLHGRWFHFKNPLRRESPRALVTAGKGKNKLLSFTADAKEEFSTDEFLKNEVDPILDKISAHGIQSLTARERETLEKARAKMVKR